MVNLMHDYCPRCFKGPTAHGKRVPSTSPDIDVEQKACANTPSCPLPLINLASEGSPCPSPCKLICLICGGIMALGCETEFEQALEIMEDHDTEMMETNTELYQGLPYMHMLATAMAASAEKKLARRLCRLGMALHPRWRRLVHHSCLCRAPCKCILPKCLDACPQHPNVAKKRQAKPAKKRVDVDGNTRRETAPKAAMQPEAVRYPLEKKPTMTATWLKRPSSQVSIPVLPLSQAQRRPANAMRAKPKDQKPNAALQAAAAGCHKLDKWSKHAAGHTSPASNPPTTGFNLKEHMRNFDPFQHGYWRVNGGHVYRFPDGRQVPVTSTMNELTEDGQLIPR